MVEKNQNKSNGIKRGGARPNAGRKKGAATKKTREIANKAAEQGITPLEVMLKTMTELMNEAQALKQNPAGGEDGQSPIKMMMAAANVAKDAAPYIHPRLANVSVEASGEMSFTITTGVPKKDD